MQTNFLLNMDISSRIKKLGKYFETMQVVPGENGRQLIYVVVNFPPEWPVDEEGAKKRNVTVANGNAMGQYIFCTDINTGDEAIFDAIDENIEKMKEAMERARLLKEKTQELRKMFENEEISVEKLASIKFVINGEEPADEVIITTKNQDKK